MDMTKLAGVLPLRSIGMQERTTSADSFLSLSPSRYGRMNILVSLFAAAAPNRTRYHHPKGSPSDFVHIQIRPFLSATGSGPSGGQRPKEDGRTDGRRRVDACSCARLAQVTRSTLVALGLHPAATRRRARPSHPSASSSSFSSSLEARRDARRVVNARTAQREHARP